MITNENKVFIYALGGLGEVGKNSYCIESNKTLIMIDAGVKFPDSELPGVDYVIPDYSHIKNNRSKFKALFITHGHEDHIGGIPFLIQNLYVPVIYAPKLAASLIKNKLETMRIKENIKIVEYDPDSVVEVGDFKVSFFRVTHSIPDAFGICVDTKEGRIVTTGDFKIDLTPIGPDIELPKLAKLGIEGVDLLMSDSTNAEIEGYTPSEKNVIASIDDIFAKIDRRIIMSTFSSNISRIQQIVEAAVKHNRKVAILGRSMESTVSVSRRFGYIKIPDSSLINPDNIKLYRPNEICILCTGSQGEEMAALSRIANNSHQSVKLLPGDTVVFSSSPIPGNGANIEKVVNKLVRGGANVFTNGGLFSLHSSGHPSKQELRFMIKLLNPKYFMPVHGEYRMLKLHAEIAQSLNIPKENTFIMSNGQTLELSNHKIVRGDDVLFGNIYLDGNDDINGLSSTIIKERNIMLDDGAIIFNIIINKKTNSLLVAPKVLSEGFVYSGNALKKYEKELKRVVEQLLPKKLSTQILKDSLINYFNKYFLQHNGTEPMIVPQIMYLN